MKIKKDVNELQKGMYVCELDRPWIQSTFLFQGFEITTEDELVKLRDECKFVYVDTEKSPGYHNSSRSNATSSTRNQGVRFVDTVNMSVTEIYDDAIRNNIGSAKNSYVKAHECVRGVFSNFHQSGQIDLEAAEGVVSEIIEEIITKPDTMVLLCRLKEKDEYTANHSVNVCILSLVIARSLGLTKAELHNLGLGALLFDIGKSKLPEKVLKKSDSLTNDEFLLMKAHPYLGHTMLKDSKNISKEVLDIILSHHERLNGTGYPNRLKGDQIGRLVRIVSIADMYDAMTSDRIYKDAYHPQHALNELYNKAPDELDQELVEEFIKCIGIYPVGSIVELNTGHIGVVVKLNEQNKLKPVVALVLSRKREPYEMIRFLNLSSNIWQKSSGDKVEIAKLLEPHAFDIDVRTIIRKIIEA